MIFLLVYETTLPYKLSVGVPFMGTLDLRLAIIIVKLLQAVIKLDTCLNFSQFL